jgi:hypothetical protein
MPKLKVGGDEVEDIEKVVEFLENEGLPFTWGEVKRVVGGFGLGGEGFPDAFTSEAIVHEVISEGIRRSVGVAGKFLDLLGVPLPSREGLSHDLERQLSWDRKAALWCFRGEKGFYLEMGIEDPKLGETLMKQRLRLPDSKRLRAIGEIGLEVQPGRAALRSPTYAPELAVSKGRAFFKVKVYGPKDLEEAKKAPKKVKALAPLLSLMGVEDLREAIEALRELKVGEVREEGPYLLASGERSLALRRGGIFGDPEFDGALLLERNVSLAFPGEVEVSFRPCWTSRHVYLRRLKIRWEDEAFRGEEGFWADPLLRNPITEAIRNGLRREFELLENGPLPSSLEGVSAKMLAFLRAFVAHEDPFRALAEGRLHRYATAELFADF